MRRSPAVTEFPLAIGTSLAVPWMLILSACSGLDTGTEADLVLLNGTVITVDSQDNVAEAVAVQDGKIVAVGIDREVERWVGPGTTRIDLEGSTVTPGLLDAHAHFAYGGTRRLYLLDLSYPNVKSVADIVALVATQVERLEPGDWVHGAGWDEGKFSELRYIYASDLDSVAPDNPVWLNHTMGHYGTANSRALRLAGIDENTPDPPGGTIDRYSDGTPTGVLKESAQDLVSDLIPDFSPEQWRAGIRELAREFNAECMTGVKDPGIAWDTWEAYQDVLAAGDLTVRVFVLWCCGPWVIDRVASFTKPYDSTGDDHLISGGAKLYLDGSGGARTAWLHDDWNKDFSDVDQGNRGYPVDDPEEIRELIRTYHDAGLHVSVHAIGDRAIDWTVDSYASALQANPISGLRHGIIHANIPTDHAINLMAELQGTYDAAYPEPSSIFMWWIGDTYAGNFGPERSRRLNPFRTYLEKGIRWAQGSDYYVAPFPARYGLWASMERETLLGVYGPNPFGKDESLDIVTALRSYTIWSARQMFLEEKIGSIEVGKYADLAVWDKNLYEIPPAEIKDLRCLMTTFQGQVVYRNPEAALGTR
ncbi:MAG: amidohydrolase family protein [Gemmatimonadetes bacterium]|nr:amidohydrolase family protein [Gemmatimonadota bacterium]NIO32738.1 amidohydrolase family protein [Gemmatimonadota bacterium]